MLRWVLAVMLVSCGALTSVTTTPSPSTEAARSAPVATRSPTPSVRSSPTPEPTSVAACAASQLRAVAAGTMATDFYVGAGFIANPGTAPCTLRGNPQVLLLASDGSPLDVMRASITGSGTPTLVVVPVSQFVPDPAGFTGAGATSPLQWS